MREDAAQSVVHLALLRKCMENYNLARSKQEVCCNDTRDREISSRSWPWEHARRRLW